MLVVMMVSLSSRLFGPDPTSIRTRVHSASVGQALLWSAVCGGGLFCCLRHVCDAEK